MKLLFSVLFVLFFIGCKPEAASLPDNLAKAYGVDNFTKVKSVEFIFNVQKGDKHIARHWKWYPKDKKVALISPQGTTYYHQSSKLTKEEKEMDAKFINDSYWLLFPLHLKWDRKNILTVVEENAVSPIGKLKTTLLTVKFKNGNGYTPDDAYDLYLSENEIIEWAYRKGGGKDAKAMTWEDNKNFDGIKISTKHQNAGGDFKLWFDGIVVE